MKTILFSPVGTADPMTMNGDGPLMHICRHCKPDEVHLFLSEKMAGYEDIDHRYTKGVRRVCGATVTEHRSSALPHLFDQFIVEFQKILDDLFLIDTDHEQPRRLLNLSSGTPAMQQALATLSAFGAYEVVPIQVSTPNHDVNKGGDREDPDKKYDFDELWELNPDNNEKAENRCVEVSQPNFRSMIMERNIDELVNRYDYSGAAALCDELPEMNEQKKRLIVGAMYRGALDHGEGVKYFGGTEFAYDRHKDALPEYLQMLQLKIHRGEYADFIRALTPAVTYVFMEVLEKQCGLPPDAYTRPDDRVRDADAMIVFLLDGRKIDNDSKLKQAIGIDVILPGTFLKNKNLMDLLETYCTTQKTVEIVKSIYDFENGKHQLRNMLAHGIKKVNEKDIKRITGNTPQEILGKLCKLVKVKPDLYQHINLVIKEK